MIRDNQINMSPLYQRRNRWDQKQKSRLIESLLLNIPIPPLFLYESDYGSYEVMDGRQRLEALHDFLSDSLRLKGLEYWTEIEGLTYSELPKVFQLGVRRRTVGAIILLAESDGRISAENDVRMILFERLNTGGVRLNPQELRNALYQGSFNSMIVELSAHSLFRKVWEIPQENDPKLLENSLYASMGDCDLVLRFFMIREVMLGIRSGSLRHLLDGCAKENQHLSQSELGQLRASFLNALEVAHNLFGATCFRLPNTGRLSKSLYDAVMVAIVLQPNRTPLPPAQVTSRLSEIANAPRGIQIVNGPDGFLDANRNPGTEYALLVGRANTPQAIRDRITLLSSIIYGNGNE
ncbi:DUF262 domain-containing protein [Polaromonas sp. P2-4]|nr:DUF262 domain-containing protein [Polaromonas sp. P2-4]